MAYVKAPNMSIMRYDEYGNLTSDFFTPENSDQGVGTVYFNPVALATLSSNDLQQNVVTNSYVVNYKALPWLRFSETISFRNNFV